MYTVTFEGILYFYLAHLYSSDSHSKIFRRHVTSISAFQAVYHHSYGTLATRPTYPPVLVQDIPSSSVLM